MYSEVNLHSGTEGRPVCRFVTYPMTAEHKGPREPWPIFFLAESCLCTSCLKCMCFLSEVQWGSLQLRDWKSDMQSLWGISESIPLYCTAISTKLTSQMSRKKQPLRNMSSKSSPKNLTENIRTSRPSQPAPPAGRRSRSGRSSFASSILPYMIFC